MPIVVACNCGKRFKAGDQFAGKRTRCPGCGQTLTIPGGSHAVATTAPAAAPKAPAPATAKARQPAPARTAPAPARRAAPPPPPPDPVEDDFTTLGEPEEVFQPAAASAPVVTKKSKQLSGAAAAAAVVPGRRKPVAAGVTPRFTMSPGIIVLIVLAILIPSTITWVKLGPMKAAEEWNKISSLAEDNIQGQIARSLLGQRAKLGFDVKDVKYMPKCTNFQFDESKAFMMIKMPETVPFQGRTTDGNFYGTFYPKKMTFEADVEMMDGKHKVAGGVTEETYKTLTIDGTQVP